MNILLALGLALISAHSFAESHILFEGNYELLHEGQPIGWNIERFYFDKENKTYTHISFNKAEYLGKTYYEKVRATASESFKPISLKYEMNEGKNKTLINAKIKKQKINITTTTNSKNKKTSKKLPKGAFFSSFIKLMLINNKLELNKKMNYSVLIEETAQVLKGKSIAIEKIKLKGQWAYKVYNQIGKSSFTTYINKKGEILEANQNQLHLKSQLKQKLDVKIRNSIWSDQQLRDWFGNIPNGAINSLNNSSSSGSSK